MSLKSNPPPFPSFLPSLHKNFSSLPRLVLLRAGGGGGSNFAGFFWFSLKGGDLSSVFSSR